MRLHGYFRSSATWRVRIVLGLKGLSWDDVPVHLVEGGGQQHAPAFAQKNPMEQVPVLEVEHGGRKALLTQSVAICEFLDETHPEPPLLPEGPLERAVVRQAVEIVNSGVQPLQNLSVLEEVKRLGGDPAAFARAANERGARALEAIARESAGPFMVGSRITLADVFLVPQLFGARRFGVDLSSFPKIAAIDAALAQHPAFAAAHPDRQPDSPKAP